MLHWSVKTQYYLLGYSAHMDGRNNFSQRYSNVCMLLSAVKPNFQPNKVLMIIDRVEEKVKTSANHRWVRSWLVLRVRFSAFMRVSSAQPIKVFRYGNVEIGKPRAAKKTFGSRAIARNHPCTYVLQMHWDRNKQMQCSYFYNLIQMTTSHSLS